MAIALSLPVGELVAKRYRVERLVGSGGAADVYEVTDQTTEERLALKRLSVEPVNAEVAEVMLAREFNALAQLSHPLIIRAFDYGRDADVPYYTMELLSGENLRDQGPLGWREACHVLRDVASALGIIHSRRLVHRDVTTRNVCRVADGHAKLLDFGALTPMGPTRDLVGTPPFVPPEALEEQRLDGRADLFALGAVAYFVLTGRHAYQARTFRELGEAWLHPVPPPSAMTPDVPAALDELVLSLLSLVRTARPRNAAEVFQRLTAIADLPPVEGPDVAQAYLATPTLVGRERALERVRRHLDRLQRGKGSTLLVEGEPGLGRTRLLGAFLLEAKLRGFLTLRTSGNDSDAGPFGVVRSLLRELSLADVTLPGEPRGDEAALLEQSASATPPPESDDWQPYAASLGDLFITAAERTPLVLAVDDVDAADERSLTVLSLLARRVRRSPLELVFTSRTGAESPAMNELRRSAKVLVLDRFTESGTRSFVSLLFGDVPHVEGLAAWMHRLTEGNPRASMELAQHLVDRRVATYHEGVWVLPASMNGLGLPETIDQALEAKLGALSPGGRDLLQTLALMTDHDPLLITDYVLLSEDANLAPTFEALNELIAASVLVSAGAAFVFTHRELVDVARRSIPGERLAKLHRRLAHVYASGSAPGTVLVMYHLYHSGDHASAFQAAVRAVTQRMDQAARGSALARSREGSKITEKLFVWGIDNAMPRQDLVLLGRSLLQIASVANVELVSHAELVLDPLRRETGLVHWDALAHIADPGARMQMCLGRAFADFKSAPAAERGLDPRTAIAELATSAAMLVGVYARQFDAAGAASLTRLLLPLRTLSPAVDVIADIIELTERSLRGHFVLPDRAKSYDRVSSPVSGLDDLSRQGIRFVALYYLALEEANYGHEGALGRVAPLDQYPHFAPLAWQVRMLVHLFRGDTEQAADARRKRDAAAIGRVDIDRHFDLSVIYEAVASAMLGDLLALERNLSVIAERARTAPGWAPYHHAFRGSYHALRGEMSKALEEHQRAHALIPVPGVHAAWGYATNCLAATLIEVERPLEAAALVERALADARTVPVVPHVICQLEMNLALAKASLGDTVAATRLAAHAVEAMLECGTRGVLLVEHYAKRALVALKAQDLLTFQATASTLEAMSVTTEGAAFVAKYEYVLRQARSSATFRTATPFQSEIVTRRESHTTMVQGLRTELENCNDPGERSARVLRVLLEWSGAETAYLYLHGPDRIALAASSTGLSPPDFLESEVKGWLRAFLSGAPVTRTSSPFESESSDTSSFETVGLVVHRVDGTLLAGVAALSRSRPRRLIPQSVLDALGDGLLAAGDAVGRPLEL